MAGIGMRRCSDREALKGGEWVWREEERRSTGRGASREVEGVNVSYHAYREVFGKLASMVLLLYERTAL